MTKLLLLIEDDKILLDMYQKLLSNHGYDVHTAMDGEDGLKKALQDHPDLILLDIRMPKMDGLTVLKYLRDDEWGKEVPVFMLTNLDDSKSISEAMNFRVERFLIKSDWKPKEIINEIKLSLKT